MAFLSFVAYSDSERWHIPFDVLLLLIHIHYQHSKSRVQQNP